VTEPVRRLLAKPWADPALAALLTAAGLLSLFAGPESGHSRLAAVSVILLGVALMLRRAHPAWACWAAAAVVLVTPAFDGRLPGATTLIVVFVLAYSCGAYASLGPGLLAVAALLVALQVAEGLTDFPNLEFTFETLPPWWVGRQIRLRGEVVRALAERTEELEAEQDAFARLSVRRERARIARELHDIVGHHLAVMVVQAGAGRMSATGNSERAIQQFESIRQSGGQALAEMARLVDILHADRGGADGRDRFRLLIDQASAGGLEVDVTPLPVQVMLPNDVEDAAFRVVQEGLTNAMKHAPGAEVHVRLIAHGEDLEVEVRDAGAVDGSALAKTGSGLGLTGMRERIESIGGSLDAGPEAHGGWCLSARLPMAVNSMG
jgi:signal transduction histidine kinase